VKFVKNLAALVLSDAVSKLISFAVVAYLARVLGPSGLGAFAWAQSAAVMLATIPNFGFTEYGILQIAPDRRREHMALVVGRIVGFRSVLGLLTAGVFVAVSSLIVRDPLQQELLLWSTFFVVSVVLGFEWFYTAVERQAVPGIVRVVSRSAYLAGCVLLVKGPSDVVPAMLVFVGSEVLLQLLLMAYARLRLDLVVRPTLDGWKETLGRVSPLAIYAISSAVFAQADVVVLGFFLPAEEVGHYAGALRVLWLVLSVKYVVAQMLYPKIVRRQAESPEALGTFLASLHTFSVVAASAVVAILASFASEIVTVALGPAFAESRWIFFWLAIGLFGEWCWIALPYAVIAANQRSYSVVMIATGALKVAAVAVLAATGGALTAAAGAGAVNMLLFILCALYLHRRIVRLDLVRMLLVPLGAVSVAGACVMLLPVPPVAVMLSAIVAAWLVLAATERRRWNPATARADLGTVTR
jgi:PST family polysaccharide transporter